MSLRLNNVISEKCLFSIAALSSVGCGFWFGRLAGISGLLSGLVVGFFLPISISIAIISILKFFRNIKSYEFAVLVQKFKSPWSVWFVIGAGIGISTGVYLGLKNGGIGILVGALAGFMSYYFITLIILKIINRRRRP